MKRSLNIGLTALAALSIIATSCGSDDEPGMTNNTTDVTFTVSTLDFSNTGEWIHCYDAAYDNSLVFDGYTFPRTATVTEYAGVKYYSWKGFTPSISTDTENHAGEWTTYQWGAITGKPVAGNAYMLACWDSQEVLTAAPDYTIPESPSVKITHDGSFKPASISITNACYTYYTMLHGDQFSKKFGTDDWLKLYVHGLRNGELTGTVTIDLAQGIKMSQLWNDYDLSSLGTVDTIYFQMASSDTSQWGMNTPGYFCLGSLTINN